MASIKDVAKNAGVSVASVSRVLNNKGYLSEHLIKKVKESMADLDYHPNEFARNFKRSRTKLIGLIIPDIQHIFFSTITRYIETELRKFDYKLLLCNAMNSENLEQNYISMLIENQVDGIIIGSHTLEIEKYIKLKLPIIALDRDLGPKIPVVSSDHYEGGLLAARELMISGCTNIVQVSAFEGSHLICNERHQSLSKYLTDRDIKNKKYELPLNVFDFDEYCKLAGKILDHDKPDGIFAEDIVATAFLKEAKNRDISIPESLKIVGYDGTILRSMVSPTLTSIVQPIDKLASRIAALLLAQIQGKEDIEMRTLLPTKLVKGETTI